MTPGQVRMYVCGVTSYAPAHIGHGRSAVAFDIVRRWLTYRGFEVTFVYNITDVEDTIIAASTREARGWKELAEGYTDDLLRDLRALNVLPPSVMPRASEHIADIIALIQALVDRGHAYALDGDVAFYVPSFPEYGRLSRRDFDSQLAGVGWRKIPASAIPATSSSGRPPSPASRAGTAPGAPAAPAGISSARP